MGGSMHPQTRSAFAFQRRLHILLRREAELDEDVSEWRPLGTAAALLAERILELRGCDHPRLDQTKPDPRRTGGLIANQPDEAHEIDWTKRLDHEGACADGAGEGAILGIVASGEEDHADGFRVVARPYFSAHREPIAIVPFK